MVTHKISHKTMVERALKKGNLTIHVMQAVFLAYYLSSDTFPGAKPIDFAFVGGLSISIGKPTSHHIS